LREDTRNEEILDLLTRSDKEFLIELIAENLGYEEEYNSKNNQQSTSQRLFSAHKVEEKKNRRNDEESN